MIKIAEGTEHAHSSSSAKRDDQPLFFRILDNENLDGEPYILIYLHSVLGCFREEHPASNDFEADFLGRGIGVDELT